MSYYFDNNPDTVSNEQTIKAIIQNKVYVFKSDNSVFSKKNLDFGTRTLLESLDLSKIKGNVLDFGCGYGAIGIYINLNTNATVDMVDINSRAVALANKNAINNKANVNVFFSNVYSNVLKKYDYIITNPPIRVGKKILYEILIGAKEKLNQNGHLIFVINKDQGAKRTMEELKKYYKVDLVRKNKGFYVIDCEKILTY